MQLFKIFKTINKLMKIKTKFKNLFLFKNKHFKDQRGYFREILKEKVIKKKFPLHLSSFSKQYVLRGLHLQIQDTQGKFITVIKGKIFDIALDLRKKSSTYGKYYSCILSENNATSIYIPPGFAHGFQTLEKENYIVYSCTKYWNKKSEISIKYDDKDLNIKWPLKKKILSAKDKKGISLNKFKSVYK